MLRINPTSLFPAHINAVASSLFHLGLVLFFLLLVIAFQNFVAGEFVEGTVFVHEDDVVAVFAGGNYSQVFEDESLPVPKAFGTLKTMSLMVSPILSLESLSTSAQ